MALICFQDILAAAFIFWIAIGLGMVTETQRPFLEDTVSVWTVTLKVGFWTT